MKKNLFILIVLLSILSTFLVFKINKKTMLDEENLAVYVNNELVSTIPKKGEAIYIKSVCDNDVNVSWNNDSWGLLINNLKQKTKCNLYFYQGKTVFNFDYTGTEQTFTAPVSGIYRLETWGAQGGNGGYGGYSVGEIKLLKNTNLFIAVGGVGTGGNGYFVTDRYRGKGGFNGGGDGGLGQLYKNDQNNTYWASGYGGGGATSIQNVLINDGQLKNYCDNITNVLIVAGGGGGVGPNAGAAGQGGGFKGSSSKSKTYENTTYGGKALPGRQTGGYKFGLGQTALDKLVCDAFGCESNGGGGGGFYGGYANMTEGFGSDDSGGGGSGYIGNSLLKDKVMYCYNCEESNEESTKTISTTCSEETSTEKCSKSGNGYARIILVSIDE